MGLTYLITFVNNSRKFNFVLGVIDPLSLFNLKPKVALHNLLLACVLLSVSVFGLFQADFQTDDPFYPSFFGSGAGVFIVRRNIS